VGKFSRNSFPTKVYGMLGAIGKWRGTILAIRFWASKQLESRGFRWFEGGGCPKCSHS